MNAGASLLEPQDLQPSSPAPKSGQGALLDEASLRREVDLRGTVEIQGEFYGEISSVDIWLWLRMQKLRARLRSLPLILVDTLRVMSKPQGH